MASSTQENMAVDPDAEELFPSSKQPRGDHHFAQQSSLAQASSPHSGKDSYSGDMNLMAEARSLDANVEKNTRSYSAAASVPPSVRTAATAQSSAISSLNTPSQQSAQPSLTGRLLNSRPRRNVTADGVANFIQVTVPASREPRADPSVTTHRGLDKAFAILHANDPEMTWYPIWDTEPGETPLKPISEPKEFPPTLDVFQAYGKVGNPWDLRKIRQGEVDKKTGQSKKQKAIWCTVLCGSRFALDHVLEISTASLNAASIFVRKKDVDALDSATAGFFVGVPNSWCPLAMAHILAVQLPKHEEWMQGNVKHSYDASQFMGEEFPFVIVRSTNPRLPEGKDMLTREDNEAIQYLYTLRRLHAVEISSPDKPRVLGCLEDFRARAKLQYFSQDCDFIKPLPNNAGESARRDYLRAIAANMNFQHTHTVVEFSGITNLYAPARGELAPDAHPTLKCPKFTSLRRELLDVRRPDGEPVFRGVIQLTGAKSNTISAYYFNSDKNEEFVRRIQDLASFIYCYLTQVKQYSVRATNHVLAAFEEQVRLLARDSTWDSTNFVATPINSTSQLGFADRMSDRGIESGAATFLLPDLLKRAADDSASKAEKQKKFSDEAMNRVAESMRFKQRPGYNPTSGDNASVLTNSSHVTDGAASFRSVTTADIQTRMPERRAELNQLKDELEELSPGDPLFSDKLMADTNVETMSVNSSASAMISALYRDTQKCITKLKLRIAEVKVGQTKSSAGPSSAQQASPLSSSELDRGPTSGP